MSGKHQTPIEPKLPADAYRWNKAIRGAFKKGILAHKAGQQ